VCYLQFDKIFEPYTKYCLEQDICREYIKTKTMENELFRTFVTVSIRSHDRMTSLNFAIYIVAAELAFYLLPV